MTNPNLDKYGQLFVSRIQEEFDAKNLNASSEAKNSISYIVERERLVIEGLARVLFLEFGRGPGNPPPVDVIIDWVERRLDLAPEEVEDAAKAIVKKIAKEGTNIFTDRAKGLQLEIILADLMQKLQDEVITFEADILTDRIVDAWR